MSKCPKVVWVVACDGRVRWLPQARLEWRLEGPLVDMGRGADQQFSDFVAHRKHIGQL